MATAFDLVERWYVSFTASPPFGVAFVRRRMSGAVAVGAAFENGWALKPILEDLKPCINDALGDLQSNELIGLREDVEDADALEQLAHKIIPVSWQAMYAPAAVARQALATLLATQGPATSKFQIDAKAPGGELLAQKIDAKDFTGMVDAVALCCLRIEEDFPGGVRLPKFEPKWGGFDPRRLPRNFRL